MRAALPVIVELACLALVAIGVALVYLPAGLIVAGLLGAAVIERAA